MFNRKKEERPKRNHSGKNLSQYGLFDMSTTGESLEGESDTDLEAELLALTTGSDSKPQRRAKPKELVPAANLDAMVASSLRDIPSDEELSGSDDDDPDLLSELNELTGDEVNAAPQVPEKEAESETDMTKLLHERLKMYQAAEENAKKSGETSRARRFNRGIKTLNDLLKQANAGKAVNPDDVPPEVSVSHAVKPPAPPVDVIPEELPVPAKQADEPPVAEQEETLPVKPKATISNELVTLLTERKTQYRLAALKCKKSGDVSTAVAYMKISKQFETVLKAAENGEPVNLTGMPGPPGESDGKEESEVQQNPDTTAVEMEETEEVQLVTAGSVGEALEQRLQVYKKQEEAAKAEGNSSKARRMGRIVKQYEQAIKQHSAGKPISIDELPTPPGYAPIPTDSTTAPVASPSAPAIPPRATPAIPFRAAPATPSPPSAASLQPAADSPTPPPRAKSAGNHPSNTRIEKLVALLLNRQKEFKEAALQAKKKGEVAQAKELLRTAKGFDKVIDAARGGLPVDMDSLPVPPASRSVLDENYEIVLAEECTEDDTGTLDMLTRLEEQLTKQLKMCLSTRDHHKAIGDVAGVNRFENLALAVTRDLDVVRLAHRTNGEIPKFHYVTKSFSIVKCCTDLNDNDLELVVVRGINYNCSNPKDVDTYVKLEFMFPQDEPYRERTAVIKNTNNPEYNTTYTIPIQRTSRQCLRVFKRHGIKMEIMSRGGLFRSDQLLGTVTVKLQPLETQCELHDSFDIMDGRKKVGGKLEVRIRVRHPLVAEQIEQLNEKWLILDH